MKSGFRGFLFWKILLGFWLTYIAITQLLWLGFSLYGKHHEPRKTWPLSVSSICR